MRHVAEGKRCAADPEGIIADLEERNVALIPDRLVSAISERRKGWKARRTRCTIPAPRTAWDARAALPCRKVHQQRVVNPGHDYKTIKNNKK